jgi:hypothetical protein
VSGAPSWFVTRCWPRVSGSGLVHAFCADSRIGDHLGRFVHHVRMTDDEHCRLAAELEVVEAIEDIEAIEIAMANAHSAAAIMDVQFRRTTDSDRARIRRSVVELRTRLHDLDDGGPAT